MKTVRLKNYKCFEDTGEISLAPINFLVGANSSGKSSLLEFFPLLQQSMKAIRDGAFLWVGNNVDANDFLTVVKKGKDEIVVEMCIEKIPLSSGVQNTKKNYLEDVVLSIKIISNVYGDNISEIDIHFNEQDIKIKLYETESDEIIVNGESMKDDKEHVAHGFTNSLLPKIFFAAPSMEEVSLKRNRELFLWVKDKFKDDDHIISPFFLFRLRNLLDNRRFRTLLEKHKKEDAVITDIEHIYNIALLRNINEIIDLINFYMLDLADKMVYIQPLRATAERYYRKRNFSVNKITPSGDNVAMFFLRLKKEGRLVEFNDWLQNSDMGFKVGLNEIGGMVEIKIVEDGKDEANIVDVGFGYSQILPILATIWQEVFEKGITNKISYCKTSIILIEQPELHLHPRFQKKIAELLVKCVNQAQKTGFDIRFIIETHSQDIINSVGLSVAYKELDPVLVNIYIFNAQNENMKNYIEKANFTREGFLDNWPIGFFD